jgi:hypothetical protein
MLIVVCQGRQRRGAAAAGEEQLGSFTTGQSKRYRLYLNNSKLALEAMYLRRVRIAGLKYAAGVPPLAHVLAVVIPPALAARNLGVDLRRPCRD